MKKISNAVSYLTLAILSSLTSQSFAQSTINLTVNWRADRKVNDAQTYQINGWDCADPAIAQNTDYLANLSAFKVGMIRMHNLGIYPADLSAANLARSWITDTTVTPWTWNATKIAQVYTAVRPKAADFMQSIPNWPPYMANSSGRLSDGTNGTVDYRQTYANWCADLVRIINITNGQNVKYWEPLNEIEQKYHGFPAELADVYNRCAVAMKAVDPTIKVGGPAYTNPYPENPTPSGADTTSFDSPTFLPLIKANMDFFSYHNYVTGGIPTNSDDIYSAAKSIGTNPAILWRPQLNTAGIDKTVPIFVGESNLTANGLNDQNTGYMRSMLGGNFVALAIKYTGETPDARGLQFFNDLDGNYGFMRAYNYQPVLNSFRASGQVLALANTHLIGTSVGVTTTDITRLNLYAVKSADGTKKAVLLVNTSDVLVNGVVQTGTTYNASLTFLNGWLPQNVSNNYTTYTIAASSSDSATYTTAVATYTSGTLPAVSMPPNTIKLIVFKDVANDPNVITRYPIADTYVDQSKDGVYYGSDTSIRAFTNGNQNKESFLRFDFSNVGGTITNATLRLHPVSSVTTTAVATNQLDFTTTNTWAEANTTWTGKPVGTGSYLNTWPVPVWTAPKIPDSAVPPAIDFNFTSYAQAAANDAVDKTRSLHITNVNNIDNRYGSREGATEYRSEMIITRTPAPTTFVAVAEADTYVSESSPGSNYGTVTSFAVKKSDPPYNIEAFVRFNFSGLSGVTSVTNAKVYLYTTDINGASGQTNAADFVANNTWAESGATSGITWNSKPVNTPPAIASWTTAVGTDAVIDVTTQVNAALAGDKKLSLRIYGTNSVYNGVSRYATREATTANQRPELQIQY